MEQKNFGGSTSKEIDSSPPKPVSQNPTVSAGAERPLRLVYCDESGKFMMDPEAVATLQLIKGPIGVVSVFGRARQGKSFILNQLLGRSSGFQVASTHQPCTKGLWVWSAPLKRTALDGTEYNLLLLDSEGIDAYDQTGTYSTQIFSLAVLLSSMFIYNQMGGIDEAALDRLSLVTEMTKHICVRASGGRTTASTASELGQFSPVFVWLLRDFYLDLVEDNRKIMPRDYLDLALRPMQGGGKEMASKNEIRESIRALFPDRECFTLVRPLNSESDLQRLDQISLDKLRPEFRSGLDALTKFVFERTRPKQVGATTMTGPVLAGITQSFLDALNNGAVPTISSSWQSVEEAECRRAYDVAADVYMSSFDRTKPPEESVLREEHEHAVQKSLAAFNASAVGAGSARQKYEKLLQSFFKKAFEDYRRNAFIEADLRCLSTIQSMEKKLRAACYAPDAKFDHVIKVLEGLLSEYETSSHGQAKWQKLTTFLQQSLEGPIHDLVKKHSFILKCRSIEDKLILLDEQLKVNEKYKDDYLRRYEEALSDKKKIADDYTIRITNLQGNCSSLEERCLSISKSLELAMQESAEWKRKYQQSSLMQRNLHNECNSLEERYLIVSKFLELARQESYEWKRKYEQSSSKQKNLHDKCNSLEKRCSSMSKSLELAKKESSEWKRKYEQSSSKQKAQSEASDSEPSFWWCSA